MISGSSRRLIERGAAQKVATHTKRPLEGGQLEAGYYSVADGVATMRDENGKPTGKEWRLGPGDDARQIASRLARQAWEKRVGTSDFNRPLDYARGGYA
jgi:hypothetical protein